MKLQQHIKTNTALEIKMKYNSYGPEIQYLCTMYQGPLTHIFVALSIHSLALHRNYLKFISPEKEGEEYSYNLK